MNTEVHATSRTQNVLLLLLSFVLGIGSVIIAGAELRRQRTMSGLRPDPVLVWAYWVGVAWCLCVLSVLATAVLQSFMTLR